MFRSVDHIGFAVRDIEEAIAFYTRMFDVSVWERLAMPERHMAVAITGVAAELALDLKAQAIKDRPAGALCLDQLDDQFIDL